MYNVRLTTQLIQAKEIVFNIEGNVEYYAKTFLNIYNNAKSYREVFLKFENFYDNRIRIVTTSEQCESVIEFLQGFNGTIVSVRDCGYLSAEIFDGYKFFTDIDKWYENTEYSQNLEYNVLIEV